MKYHYIIVSSFDPTDIPVDSRTFEAGNYDDWRAWEGWETSERADAVGESELKRKGLNPDQYYVKVIPVSPLENISPVSIESEDAIGYNKTVYEYGDVNRVEAYRERAAKKGYYK